MAELVRDGDTVALEGFTHLIPFAAGHEIIRQGRRDLTLVRMTPDLVYDQLIGAGCAAKLVFSWGGNPGRRVAAPHARRAGQRLARAAGDRGAQPRGHGQPLRRRAPPGCRSRCCAATRAPTCPSTRPRSRPSPARSPARSWPPCRRSTRTSAIVHAQRADRRGNVQLWGITGVQKEAVLAVRRALVTVEEIVDELDAGARRGGAAALGGRRGRGGPRAAPPRPTRRATTTATTPPTAPGTRSAATATRSAGGSRRVGRVSSTGRRRDDERRRGPRPARRPGVLRRDRAAVHRGQPGPPPARARTWC